MTEKINELIKIREMAISEEKEILEKINKGCKKEIKESTKKLVKEVYQNLIILAVNPYIVALEDELRLYNDEKTIEELKKIIEEIIKNQVGCPSNEDEDEIQLNNFRKDYLVLELNQDGLFGIDFQGKTYLTYEEILKEIFEEYGINYEILPDDECDNYQTVKIKVSMESHTLKYTK